MPLATLRPAVRPSRPRVQVLRGRPDEADALGIGDRGAVVDRIHGVLSRHGFAFSDGEVFGEATQRGVVTFQRLYGLEPTGTVDWACLFALESLDTEWEDLLSGARHLERGHVGQGVVTLQRHLALLGYRVRPHGRFCALTAEAIRHLQRRHGMKSTGSVGPTTAWSIEREVRRRRPRYDRSA